MLRRDRARCVCRLNSKPLEATQQGTTRRDDAGSTVRVLHIDECPNWVKPGEREALEAVWLEPVISVGLAGADRKR